MIGGMCRPRPDLIVLVVLLLAAACGPTSQVHTYADEGKVCVLPQSADINAFLWSSTSVSLAADRAVEVSVMMPTCLSSSCSHEPQADCTATLTGNDIDVTSKGSYIEQGDVCTSDCGALVARCTTPPLPAGRYQLRHGQEALTFTVPFEGIVPCAGRAP